MIRRAPALTVLLLASMLSAALIGCRRQPPPAAPPVSFARLDSIVKSSGGDWKKVSPADQNYITKEFGKGDQKAATMVFYHRAAKLTAYLRWMRRVDGMVKRSGGNWNKLPQKDRDYLVYMVSKGDEKAAMITFQERVDLQKTKAQARP